MTAIMVIVMVYQSAVTNEARARDELKQVNLSHPPLVPYICVNWILSALVLIMAYRLYGVNQLSDQMLGYYKLDP